MKKRERKRKRVRVEREVEGIGKLWQKRKRKLMDAMLDDEWYKDLREWVRDGGVG